MTGRGTDYYDVTLSTDYKFFAVSLSKNIVERGSIAQGYTDVSDLSNSLASSILFSPNNQFYFSGVSGEVQVAINCNWNTSGNFFFNSNSNMCEECLGCADCGLGGVCNQCDEANNYFMDNGSCVLCVNVTNCRTCATLSTCSVCESGYELDSSSECIQAPTT